MTRTRNAPGTRSRRYHRTLRLTEAEDQELERRAAAAGLTVSAYLRQAALAKT